MLDDVAQALRRRLAGGGGAECVAPYDHVARRLGGGGCNLFQEPIDLNRLTHSILLVVVVTVVFEQALHHLTHFLEHNSLHEYRTVVGKVTGELMILGFISFGVLMTIQFGMKDKFVQAYLLMFELAHVWIFSVGIFFAIIATVWLILGTLFKLRWTQWSAMDKRDVKRHVARMEREAVHDKLTQLRRTKCCVTLLGPDAQVETLEYHLFQTYFKTLYNGDVKSLMGKKRAREFDFSEYLTLLMNHTFVEQLETSLTVWLVLVVLIYVCLAFRFILQAASSPAGSTSSLMRFTTFACLVTNLVVVAMIMIARWFRGILTKSAYQAFDIDITVPLADAVVLAEAEFRESSSASNLISHSHGHGGHGGGHGGEEHGDEGHGHDDAHAQDAAHSDAAEEVQDAPVRKKLSHRMSIRQSVSRVVDFAQQRATAALDGARALRFIPRALPWVSEVVLLVQIALLGFVVCVNVPAAVQYRAESHVGNWGGPSEGYIHLFLQLGLLLIAVVLLQPGLLKNVVLINSLVGDEHELLHILYRINGDVEVKDALIKSFVRLVESECDGEVAILRDAVPLNFLQKMQARLNIVASSLFVKPKTLGQVMTSYANNTTRDFVEGGRVTRKRLKQMIAHQGLHFNLTDFDTLWKFVNPRLKSAVTIKYMQSRVESQFRSKNPQSTVEGLLRIARARIMRREYAHRGFASITEQLEKSVATGAWRAPVLVPLTFSLERSPFAASLPMRLFHYSQAKGKSGRHSSTCAFATSTVSTRCRGCRTTSTTMRRQREPHLLRPTRFGIAVSPLCTSL
jgi:hypothetical protein